MDKFWSGFDRHWTFYEHPWAGANRANILFQFSIVGTASLSTVYPLCHPVLVSSSYIYPLLSDMGNYNTFYNSSIINPKNISLHEPCFQTANNKKLSLVWFWFNILIVCVTDSLFITIIRYSSGYELFQKIFLYWHLIMNFIYLLIML